LSFLKSVGGFATEFNGMQFHSLCPSSLTRNRLEQNIWMHLNDEPLPCNESRGLSELR